MSRQQEKILENRDEQDVGAEDIFLAKQNNLRYFFRSKYGDWEPSMSDWVLINNLIRQVIAEHNLASQELKKMRIDGQKEDDVKAFRGQAFFSSIEKEVFCRYLNERLGIVNPGKFLDESSNEEVEKLLKY